VSFQLVPLDPMLAGLPHGFAGFWDAHITSIADPRARKGTSRTLYMQDYGGPVGFRMAVAHPDRIEALIVQDGR
jgi:pimeloyl-ACP methyl ester carboxylesterase